ncbi:hypothetical protein BRADI_4g05781v3 [Brachypodium distachyon]|uniref:Uncharacterized protein n=1 Tax=Brachypodium distachyon TaxID=15368 RepID=A0A2K2CKQ2_BRADI|nr:hypothetical protein BRADI_4g05781v3 [Brachypodium distachyon]
MNCRCSEDYELHCIVGFSSGAEDYELQVFFLSNLSTVSCSAAEKYQNNQSSFYFSRTIDPARRPRRRPPSSLADGEGAAEAGETDGASKLAGRPPARYSASASSSASAMQAIASSCAPARLDCMREARGARLDRSRTTTEGTATTTEGSTTGRFEF